MALANLCYLRIWSEALTYDRADTFWMKHPPLPAELLALIFNVTLVGALLACGAAWARRAGGWTMQIAEWMFLLFLVIPLDGVRWVLYTYFQFWHFGSAVFKNLVYGGVMSVA